MTGQDRTSAIVVAAPASHLRTSTTIVMTAGSPTPLWSDTAYPSARISRSTEIATDVGIATRLALVGLGGAARGSAGAAALAPRDHDPNRRPPGDAGKGC